MTRKDDDSFDRRRRELTAVARSIESDTGLTYREARDGGSIRGVYRRTLDLASGRFAMLDDGVGFSLVPMAAGDGAASGATATRRCRWHEHQLELFWGEGCGSVIR